MKMSFTDVAAIVYYATVIPWEFPNFDIESAMPKLHRLQEMLQSQGEIVTYEDRFIIVAPKY